ncbi:thioredoxin-dependent thiol peroxidase [Marinobacter confluentis]|uniref:thioredoxin-dependent peroxiredoxin n=1 Tax=Marinobacter confluentis TaxID=1697557 RepID=A0A4Z1BRN4_9GAMM|nr:thioredoxin-dependent thiol peroxidase [Marinobacter confluentis]TGN40305.1 thioredoxin-dependent thiol peroxidase [Marinobacter confluentis]
MSWEGKTAPDFTLQDQESKEHTLSAYQGQKVLLYFYPRDNTPGCTIEAQQFRDRLDELASQGVQVLGVSRDTVKSHEKFARKESLNFPILADPDEVVVNQYEVLKQKNMYGKQVMSVNRESFLIDEKGVIVRHFGKVKPAEHVQEILDSLK